MIRFIFYLIFTYLIIRILRIFIDPFFVKNNSGPNTTFSANTEDKKSTLGDYIEYEEIK